jgi:KDO2-lipid IV(A) lauroyltransferase
MQAFVVKAFIYFCSLLPLRAAHALGAAVATLLIVIPNKPKAIATVNIAKCFPQLPARERKVLLHKTLRETGKTLSETGALWRWNTKRVLKLVRQVSGGEALDQAVQQGRGAIVAAPHLGAWEMVGLYWAGRHPMTSLYRPPRLKALDRLMHHARQRSGSTLVPTDAQGVKALLQGLKRHELIGILPDQDPGKEGGVFAPFFGIPTNTMTLLPRLAQKSGAAVFFVFAERLPKGRGYHMHVIPADAGIASKDLNEAAAYLNKGVEQSISHCPAQYQWIYKRFKTRPEGEAKFY